MINISLRLSAKIAGKKQDKKNQNDVPLPAQK